jgi:hypothetical protein
MPESKVTEFAVSEHSREVVLEGGKYRFWIDARGALRCDRHGTAWRDFIADKAVRALFDEVIARAPAKSMASHWDEDPRYSVAAWRYEVVNDDTRLGYREWVEHHCEAVPHSEARAPNTQPRHPGHGDGPIAIEFVSSDSRALDWSCRCNVLWSRDGFFDWLELRKPADQFNEDVLKYEDGEGSDKWLSAEDLLHAAVDKDGRFHLKGGDEVYFIGERNLRWEPTAQPFITEEASPSP